MTSVRRIAGVLLLGLLFTAPVFAANIVDFRFDGTAGNSLGGYLVYEYYADINNGPVQTVMCDDFYGKSDAGVTWPAYQTYLSTGDVTNTKFQDFTLYQEVAWLYLQAASMQDPVQQGEINWAIWEMTSPGLSFVWDPSVQLAIASWESAAITNYLNGPTPAWQQVVIYTPLDRNRQEMIGLAATPEPGTMLLLGTSMVGLWSQRKRFF